MMMISFLLHFPQETKYSPLQKCFCRIISGPIQVPTLSLPTPTFPQLFTHFSLIYTLLFPPWPTPMILVPSFQTVLVAWFWLITCLTSAQPDSFSGLSCNLCFHAFQPSQFDSHNFTSDVAACRLSRNQHIILSQLMTSCTHHLSTSKPFLIALSP